MPLWLVLLLVVAIAVATVPVTRRACVLVAVFGRRIAARAWQDEGLASNASQGEGGERSDLPKPDRYTTARAFRLAFEDLGPAYVKLGQMIASSPTAFPAAVTDEFALCLDQVRPIPVEVVRAVIDEELGAGKLAIDAEPLASASVAQVHTATLPSGERVVVKVQRPGVRRRVEDDLALMGALAWIARDVQHAAASRERARHRPRLPPHHPRGARLPPRGAEPRGLRRAARARGPHPPRVRAARVSRAVDGARAGHGAARRVSHRRRCRCRRPRRRPHRHAARDQPGVLELRAARRLLPRRLPRRQRDDPRRRPHRLHRLRHLRPVLGRPPRRARRLGRRAGVGQRRADRALAARHRRARPQRGLARASSRTAPTCSCRCGR